MQIDFFGPTVLPRVWRSCQSQRVSPRYVRKKRTRGRSSRAAHQPRWRETLSTHRNVSDRLDQHKAVFSPPHVSLFGHTPFVNEDAASCWPRCCRKLANGSFLRGNLQPHFARFSKIFFLSVSVCACLQCARRERAENQSMSRGLYCWKWNHLMFHPLPTRKEWLVLAETNAKNLVWQVFHISWQIAVSFKMESSFLLLFSFSPRIIAFCMEEKKKNNFQSFNIQWTAWEHQCVQDADVTTQRWRTNSRRPFGGWWKLCGCV